MLSSSDRGNSSSLAPSKISSRPGKSMSSRSSTNCGDRMRRWFVQRLSKALTTALGCTAPKSMRWLRTGSQRNVNTRYPCLITEPHFNVRVAESCFGSVGGKVMAAEKTTMAFGWRVYGLGVMALGMVCLAWGDFDPGPSTDRHRIPSGREPASQRSAARKAYPVHRR